MSALPSALVVGGRTVTLGWATVGEGRLEDLPAAEQRILSVRAVAPRRAQFVAGRLAARRALALLGWEDHVVLRTLPPAPDAGRPRLGRAEGGGALPVVSVSLTHSGTLACAALAPGRGALGIDLELAPLPTTPAFLEEAFAEGELEGFASFGARGLDPVRAAWTLKEAALKVWGVGLRAPLAQVRLCPGLPSWTEEGAGYACGLAAGGLPADLPAPPRILTCRSLRIGGAVLSVALAGEAAHPLPGFG